MKLRNVLAWFLLVMMAMAWREAQGASIVFQQGLNGYSGCQDSFVNTGQYGEDAAGVCYGLNRFLILNSEHYENF